MTTIREEVRWQQEQLWMAKQTPRTVIFSTEGWRRAVQQSVDSPEDSPTYMGMDRITDPEQVELVTVTREPLQEVDKRIKEYIRSLEERPTTYAIWQDVSDHSHPNRFCVVETIYTSDGYRSRITNGSYRSKADARATVEGWKESAKNKAC